MLSVNTLQAAMPSAIATVIFLKQFGGDANFATKGVMLSTLSCVVTVPVIAILINLALW